ncbi:MAG: hypothetical protein CVT89_01215 [Candidatus Altiarchaeales archaeon HGW-Altiarchaeales-2]|nr:MAG: hypothetical protein CVT89_01215 [Candidatus Altiarchaeales archaeon HGW-Altiarchaeales-2]
MSEILSEGKLLLTEYKGSVSNIPEKFKRAEEKGKIIYLSLNGKHVPKTNSDIVLSEVPEFHTQKGIEILPHLLFEIIRDTIASHEHNNISGIIIEIDEIFEKFRDKSKISDFLSALKSVLHISNITVVMLTKSPDDLLKKYGLNKNLFD